MPTFWLHAVRHLLLLTLLVLFLPVTGARAEEEILLFQSTIRVQENGDLVVTERIRVRAEGRRIRHGIYRDFPLLFRKPDATTGVVGFRVLRVERDGRPEPWFRKDPKPGVARIYFGSRDTFVESGVHTYTLTYTTTRQIRFFPDHDELYWNVTGNGWVFPIRRARVRVRLPEGASITRHALFTGRLNSRESDARVLLARGNRFMAETTRMLAPGEGFSFVIAFPKGIVAEPSPAQRAWWWVQDMIGPFWLVAGAAAVFSWLFLAWWRYGRDPEPGVIIPRWRPPRNISPAAAQRLLAETAMLPGSNRRDFIAALVSLATKGYLAIERLGAQTLLRRLRPADDTLPPGEALLMRELFATGEAFLIGKSNGERLQEVLERFSGVLEREIGRAYLVRNRRHFAIGLALAGLTLAGLIALSILGFPSAGSILSMALFTAVPLIFVAVILWQMRKAQGFGRWMLLPFLLFVSAMAYVFLSAALFDIPAEGVLLPGSWRYAVFVALLALPLSLVSFWYLLPKPTTLGRKLLDQIEGLRMFIETAEKERLNHASMPGTRGAPPMSRDLFEKLLPWAIALGVEEPWTRAFRKWLERAMPKKAAGYSPAWYVGGSLDDVTSMSRSTGLVSSLDSAISSAMPVPSTSSSGFGGGGGVGGGGGGGGGGGW